MHSEWFLYFPSNRLPNQGNIRYTQASSKLKKQLEEAEYNKEEPEGGLSQDRIAAYEQKSETNEGDRYTQAVKPAYVTVPHGSSINNTRQYVSM